MDVAPSKTRALRAQITPGKKTRANRDLLLRIAAGFERKGSKFRCYEGLSSGLTAMMSLDDLLAIQLTEESICQRCIQFLCRLELAEGDNNLVVMMKAHGAFIARYAHHI
jgi:hypothetical protein